MGTNGAGHPKLTYMDYVFVLEDDPVYQRQIVETLKRIQESFEIRTFVSLDGFSSLVKAIMTHGAKALATDDGEIVRVVLVVTRLEFIGVGRLSLLEKTKDLFVRRGVCTAEEPTQFVVTAFDEPDFKIEPLMRNIVANVIFKPFDRLILHQHLQLAMPQVKAGSDALSMQKASALVEMLKSVTLESMTELGFTSSSNRPFEVGAVNKYYGRDFASERQRSVMARLVSCTPVGPGETNYQLDFRFFALDSTQITNIRKKVRAKDASSPKEIRPPITATAIDPKKPLSGMATARLSYVIIDSSEDEARNLAGTLQRKIGGAVVSVFVTRKEFEDDLNFSENAATLILSDGDSLIEMDRAQVVTNCLPDTAKIWGEPLQGTALNKYFSKEDGQNLGLWLMGKKAEIVLRTSYNGKYGALKFVRKDGKILIIEIVGAERSDFLREFRKVKLPIAAIFVRNNELDIEHPAAWLHWLDVVKTDQGGRLPPVYLMSNREFTDDEERALGGLVSDVFFQPLDRIYLVQKLLFEIPNLKILEDPVVVHDKKMPQVIRAASPVKMEEISEAVLVINYYRAIEIQSFREFVLWQPYEIIAPELRGVVHKIDAEGDEKNPTKIRFTFFGVHDHQLKAIRLWILNNYIQGKEKDGGG